MEPESSSRNSTLGSTFRLDALAIGACEMSVVCAVAGNDARPEVAPSISAAASLE